VYLPLTLEQSISEMTELRPAGDVPVGAETVLLVEDEDGIRTMMRSFLEQKGYMVLDARTGEEALKLSSAFSNDIHLLVSDIVMPGMRGTELADHLRRARPGLKVLLMSGYSPVDIDQRSIHLLEKPFAMEDFGHRVRRVIDSTARSVDAH
jgi:DNA-binding NtrC family response regulator